MVYKFSAVIYKSGINAVVDVPKNITRKLKPVKGYIRISGAMNEFNFITNLVPVIDKPYLLFVNQIMLKSGKTKIGERAKFEIEQIEKENIVEEYPMPQDLAISLKKNKLSKNFNSLSNYRQKEILRYLNNLKSPLTRIRNIEKLLPQLRSNSKDVRIPPGRKK